MQLVWRLGTQWSVDCMPCTETEKSLARQPWYSLETLKLAFLTEYQGSHPDYLSVSVHVLDSQVSGSDLARLSGSKDMPAPGNMSNHSNFLVVDYALRLQLAWRDHVLRYAAQTATFGMTTTGWRSSPRKVTWSGKMFSSAAVAKTTETKPTCVCQQEVGITTHISMGTARKDGHGVPNFMWLGEGTQTLPVWPLNRLSLDK